MDASGSPLLSLSDELLLEILRAVRSAPVRRPVDAAPLCQLRLVHRRFRDAIDGAGGALALASELHVNDQGFAKAVKRRAASLSALRTLWWTAPSDPVPLLCRLPCPAALRRLALVLANDGGPLAGDALRAVAERCGALEEMQIHMASWDDMGRRRRGKSAGVRVDPGNLCPLIGAVLDSNPKLSVLVLDSVRIESFAALLGSPERRRVPLSLCLGACWSEGAGAGYSADPEGPFEAPRLRLAGLAPDACPAARALAHLHVKSCELPDPPELLRVVYPLAALSRLTLGPLIGSPDAEPDRAPPYPSPGDLPALACLELGTLEEGVAPCAPPLLAAPRLAAACIAVSFMDLHPLFLPRSPALAAVAACRSRRLALSLEDVVFDPALDDDPDADVAGALDRALAAVPPSVDQLALLRVPPEAVAAARARLGPRVEVSGPETPPWLPAPCPCRAPL